VPSTTRTPGPSAAPTLALANDLRVAVGRLTRKLRQQDPPGLTITHYAALATVADRTEMAIGELAEVEHLPSSAATRLADSLERAGYVRRCPNPRDRRGVNLAITPEGRRVVERRRGQVNQWLDGRLALMSEEDRAAVARTVALIETMMLAETAHTGEPL